MRRSHVSPVVLFTFTTLVPILLILSCSTATFAQMEKKLYAFQGGTDGNEPQSGVIADSIGNLYGNTYLGGAFGFGTTFELSPPAVSGGAWTETILHDFTGGSDGGGPIGNLAIDAAGNLYGATNFGGATNGLVFQLSPPATSGGAWTETVIYNASGLAAGVVFDRAGNLYGTNTFGGLNLSGCGSAGLPGCGSVFELSPSGGSWTSRILYYFGTNGGVTDAINPFAGVTVGDQVLFGAARGGGALGHGAVYALTLRSGGVWEEQVVHNFAGGTSDGDTPVGSLTLAGNGIYGATTFGGSNSQGMVYQVIPPALGGWIYNQIYNFTGGTDGGAPFAGMMIDQAGNLFGTTYSGGGTCYRSPDGCGTVFILSESGGTWFEGTILSFKGLNGANPIASLTLIKGTLFGTTSQGGTVSPPHGYGIVFEVGTE